MENYKLPARLMIANYCPWRYRGIGCRYGQRYNDKGPETALKKQEDWGKKIFSPEFFSPDRDVGGVPMADENDKRFDDPNNGYGLSYLMWVGQYEPEVFSTVTVSATVSTASNPTTVSVSTVPREIRIGRTVFLKNSGGTSIGSMKVTEIAKKTVNVIAASAVSSITSGTVLGLRFITGGEGYTASQIDQPLSAASGGFTGTFDTDGDGVIDSSSLAITAAGSGYTESPTVIIAGAGTPTIPGVIEATILQTLTVRTPLSVQLEIGEIITFDGGGVFVVGEVVPVGARDIRGTNTSGTVIASDNEGTLRTTIVGNVLLDTGSSLAINSTGVVGYSTGNVVAINPGSGSLIDKNEVKMTDPASDEPPAYFVCIKDHSVRQDPRFKKEYWIEDQCSKTLNGCRMRFGESAKLPFGGFPSIEAYRYTN